MTNKKVKENTDDQEYPEIDNISTEKKHAITKQEFDELTDTLKRLQAEFENYKKRTEKENQMLIKNSNANLVKDILPVLDSFELAIKNGNNTDNPELVKFKKGIELIYAQLFTILSDQGLRVIETKDKRFDPYKHEVLMVKQCDKEDDTIVEEFQKGYMLNDIVLRHSKVMIAKNHSEAENGKQ